MRANSATLGSRGVEFIDENGGGPGVRLRKRQNKGDRETRAERNENCTVLRAPHFI
jgi:hypothetical protein